MNASPPHHARCRDASVTITGGEDSVTRVSTFDVPRAEVPALVGHLGAAADALAGGPGSGLLSSAVLVAKDVPGEPAADEVRVVHHARWLSRARADAGAGTLAPGGDLGETLAGAIAVVHDQELHAVVSAAPGAVLELRAGGPATSLIFMDADPAEHRSLLDFNADDTRDLFSHRGGFVGAAIYGDPDRVRVFEVVQWATPQDFAVVAASQPFAQHDVVLEARCRAIDARPYDVVHAVSGPSA